MSTCSSSSLIRNYRVVAILGRDGIHMPCLSTSALLKTYARLHDHSNSEEYKSKICRMNAYYKMSNEWGWKC